MDDEHYLERNPPDVVAARAVGHLDEETTRALAEYAIRCGLGAHFLNTVGQDRDVDGETIGALLSITFDPETVPLHYNLLTTLHEWAEEADDA